LYIVAKLAQPESNVLVAVLIGDLEFHVPKVAGAYVTVIEPAKP